MYIVCVCVCVAFDYVQLNSCRQTQKNMLSKQMCCLFFFSRTFPVPNIDFLLNPFSFEVSSTPFAWFINNLLFRSLVPSLSLCFSVHTLAHSSRDYTLVTFVHLIDIWFTNTMYAYIKSIVSLTLHSTMKMWYNYTIYEPHDEHVNKTSSDTFIVYGRRNCKCTESLCFQHLVVRRKQDGV